MADRPTGTLAHAGIEVGSEIPPLTKVATRTHLAQFAGTLWNFSPIHVDQDAAIAQGFRDQSVNGPLMRSWIIQALMQWLGSEGMLVKLRCEFKNPGYPNDVMVCGGRVAGKGREGNSNLVDLDVWLKDAEGRTIIAGRAQVILNR